jgi:uncharacterized protein (TIGR03435 family)
VKNATMVDMISRAYGVDADKVFGGPNWLEYDRFDVIAKMPPKTSAATAKLMLQALLADRFKLVVRQDTQPLPAHALTVGKAKPKMKEADGSGQPGCRGALEGLPQPADRGGAPVPVAINGTPLIVYTCRNETMAAFAALLRGMGVQQNLGSGPVEDKTGLEGAWDFTFKMSLPIRGPGLATGENITIQDALDKQLGLKLESEKIPQPVVTVQSVNRTPTPNAPDISQKFPAAPAEFEVADVKPTAPDAKGASIQIPRGGRVNIRGLPLKTLIQEAWSVRNDAIVGAPKWIETERYDIVAKISDEAAASGPVDIDTVWVMMRALLADRFKLAAHMEDRPGTAYNLVAAKPKLKKADPASRTKWMPGAPPGQKLNSSQPMNYAFQNMTMAQFAETLQYISAPGPVADATGLEGGYDFTLGFNPFPVAQAIAGARSGGPAGDAGPAAPGVPEASDPSGAITLFEAIEKQLGLQLEAQQRPVPVLVIEHIEKPSDN